MSTIIAFILAAFAIGYILAMVWEDIGKGD